MWRTDYSRMYTYVEPQIRQEYDKCRRKSVRLQSQKEISPNPISAIDPQSECLFFHSERGLPHEIRIMIFTLALTRYEDPSRRLHRCSHHLKCRPPPYCSSRIDTALLLTCKAIYQEASLLAVAINAHVLRYGPFRGISKPAETAKRYFRSMTPEQLAAVQHIHIFAADSLSLDTRDPGQYLSHSFFAELGCMRSGTGSSRRNNVLPWQIVELRPRNMTITFRGDGWDYWVGWGRNDCNLNKFLQNKHWENVLGGLKMLRMEVEVPDPKREGSGSVVETLTNFNFNIGKGEILVPEKDLEESRWTRRSTSPQIMYDSEFYLATVIWRVEKVGGGSSSGQTV